MLHHSRLSAQFRNLLAVALVFVYSMAPFAQAAAVTPDGSQTSAYAVNLSFAREERTDPTALAFYLLPSRGIQSDDPSIIAAAQNITSGLTDDREKALAIHDWVCENIYYDYDAYNGRTDYRDSSAVNVLNERIGVCEGYANLTAALMRAAGIPAKKVSGYTVKSGETFPADALDGSGKTNHAWNEVCLNGRWVIIDATWDSGKRYEFGRFSSKGRTKHTYFDITLKEFSGNHVTMKGCIFKELSLYVDYDQYWAENAWHPLQSGGAAPILKGGTVFVPVRGFVEAIGGTVNYTPPTEKYLARIVCVKDWNYAQMWIGSKSFYAGTVEQQLPAEPFIKNGSTMAPLRMLANTLGCTVAWDANADGWHGRVTIGYTV